MYTEPDQRFEGKGRGTVEQVYADQRRPDGSPERFRECGIAQEHISNLDYYATSLLKARVAIWCRTTGRRLPKRLPRR